MDASINNQPAYIFLFSVGTSDRLDDPKLHGLVGAVRLEPRAIRHTLQSVHFARSRNKRHWNARI